MFGGGGLGGEQVHDVALRQRVVIMALVGVDPAQPRAAVERRISSAIVCADARSIRNHAASLATQLSHGMI